MRKRDKHKDRYLVQDSKFYKFKWRMPDEIYQRFSDQPRTVQRSLKTTDIEQARLLRNAILAEYLGKVEPKNLLELRDSILSSLAINLANSNEDLETHEREDLIIDLMTDEITSGIHPDDPLPDDVKFQLQVLHKQPVTSWLFLLEAMIQHRGDSVKSATVDKWRNASRWLLGKLGEPDVDITKLSKKMITGFLKTSNVSTNTKNGYLQAGLAVYKYAQDIEEIPNLPPNPFSSHNLKDDTRSYDRLRHQEIYRMHQLAKERNQLWTAHVIQSMYLAGMRISEVYQCKQKIIEDIPCWVIKTGKTSSSTRAIPIHSSMRHCEIPPQVNRKKTAQMITELALEVVVDKYHPVTGKVKKLSSHSLRVSAISAWEELGITIETRNALAGHSQSTQNGRYVRKTIEKLAGAIETIEW
jgi:integrase